MIRELINHLTFTYSIMCRAKGLVRDSQLQNMAVGAHSTMETCSALAAQNQESLTKNDRELLKEAEFIDGQIEEAFLFLQSLEIV